MAEHPMLPESLVTQGNVTLMRAEILKDVEGHKREFVMLSKSASQLIYVNGGSYSPL